jgi:hypothetical protein
VEDQQLAGANRPAVARLDVVLNEDVEAFGLSILETSAEGSFDEVRALQGVLRTATFPLPRDVERAPGPLRAFAGARPHARVRVTHYVRDDGSVDGELQWIGGGSEDVLPSEYERLVDRALALTAAAVLEHLAASSSPEQQ